MQIVIEIDEKYLEYIRKAVEVDCTAPPYFVVQNLWESTLNGTPLPKGHGDLIDRKELLKQPMDTANYPSGYVKIAPTIIEADKGDKE